MRIALAQIRSSVDPQKNLQQVRQRAIEAQAAGAELVVFPEATMRSFSAPLREIAEELDGPWVSTVRSLARELDLAIVAGVFTPAGPDKVANTVIAALPSESALQGEAGTQEESGQKDPEPGQLVHYEKIHLFDAFGFQESRTVQAGLRPMTFDYRGIRFGLATCYDVRFPDLFIANAEAGAQVTLLPTSWGAGPGKLEQWQVLSAARALDSTTYVLASDQAYADHENESAPLGIGHSRAIAPDGVVLAELGAEPGLLVVDIDPELVEQTRQRIPVLENRRRGLLD